VVAPGPPGLCMKAARTQHLSAGVLAVGPRDILRGAQNPRSAASPKDPLHTSPGMIFVFLNVFISIS